MLRRAWLLGAVLLCSCTGSRPEIELRARGKDLTDLTIILGIDKMHWARLRAGDSCSFTSTATLPAELTVLYSVDKERRSWCGPKLTNNARVEVAIKAAEKEADDRVTCRVIPPQ